MLHLARDVLELVDSIHFFFTHLEEVRVYVRSTVGGAHPRMFVEGGGKGIRYEEEGDFIEQLCRGKKREDYWGWI
jgi:hypothetical protein